MLTIVTSMRTCRQCIEDWKTHYFNINIYLQKDVPYFLQQKIISKVDTLKVLYNMELSRNIVLMVKTKLHILYKQLIPEKITFPCDRSHLPHNTYPSSVSI